MTKRLLLTVALTFSVAAMYGQPLPALHVSDYDEPKAGLSAPNLGSNKAMVQIKSKLKLSFTTQLDENNFVTIDREEDNGLRYYKLEFPTATKSGNYDGRRLKIKASNFETYTLPLLNLKAGDNVSLFVQSKADYYFNVEKNYQEALDEYYKFQSLNSNDSYVNSRIEDCKEKINKAEKLAITPNTQTNPVTPQPNLSNDAPQDTQPEIAQTDNVTTEQQYIQNDVDSLKALSGRKVVNRFGTELSKEEVRSMMAIAPKALALYDKGLSKRNASAAWGTIAVLCFVGGVVAVNEGVQEEVLVGIFGASLVCFIPCATLGGTGAKKIHSAVDIYNDAITKQQHKSAMSLNFGVTRSGGLGLMLTF